MTSRRLTAGLLIALGALALARAARPRAAVAPNAACSFAHPAPTQSTPGVTLPGPGALASPACAPGPADVGSPAPTRDAARGRVDIEIPLYALRGTDPRRSEPQPLVDIDRAVALTDDQRPAVRALVDEREVLMRAAYGDAVLNRHDVEAGIDAVTRIFADYDERICAALTSDQQALYRSGRRDRTIGAPMLVFRYGE